MQTPTSKTGQFGRAGNIQEKSEKKFGSGLYMPHKEVIFYHKTNENSYHVLGKRKI